MNENTTIPDTLLLPGREKLLWSGHPSLWAYTPLLFLAALLVYAFGLGLLLFLAILLHRKSKYYTVTDRKTTARTGFFRRKLVEIRLSEIETVRSSAPALPIVGGIGDLAVFASDGRVLFMDSIYPAPEIEKLLHDEKEKISVVSAPQ